MVKVNTEKFEWSHGKKPRGRGYWVFKLGNEHWLSIYGTYTEAKKQAIEEAKAKGIHEIEVLP